MTGNSESKQRNSESAAPGRTSGARQSRGQSIIEVLVGGVILVPIVLAIIDLAVVVLGGEICNDLAKQAARAAANAGTQVDAQTAVDNVKSHFTVSGTYSNVTLNLSSYTAAYDGTATVQSSLTITLPVPVPFLNVGPTMGVKSQATEAIVGIAPPTPGAN